MACVPWCLKGTMRGESQAAAEEVLRAAFGGASDPSRPEHEAHSAVVEFLLNQPPGQFVCQAVRWLGMVRVDLDWVTSLSLRVCLVMNHSEHHTHLITRRKPRAKPNPPPKIPGEKGGCRRLSTSASARLSLQ